MGDSFSKKTNSDLFGNFIEIVKCNHQERYLEVLSFSLYGTDMTSKWIKLMANTGYTIV